MGRVFYVIILSIDRQTCSGACLKNKGDTHGFQLDALSMDLSALSTGSILYKSRKNPKWNPGIFQSAFLCMGRACLCCVDDLVDPAEFFLWERHRGKEGGSGAGKAKSDLCSGDERIDPRIF